MMIRFFIVAFVCTTMHMSFCMEEGDNKQKSFEELPMTKINSWEDVKQFTESIVAYKIFGDDENIINYAYINDSIHRYPSQDKQSFENGYRLNKLINSNEIRSFYVLLNSFLNNNKVTLRSVTLEEIEQIKNEINKEEAKFSTQIDLSDAVYYLNSTIKRLNELNKVNNSNSMYYLDSVIRQEKPKK